MQAKEIKNNKEGLQYFDSLDACKKWCEKEENVKIFTYGSLMWRPETGYVHARKSTLSGWSRRFALYSLHYRGTKDCPGLVLSLMRGGSCCGILFDLENDKKMEAIEKIWQREMAGSQPYIPCLVKVNCNCKFCQNGISCRALTFTSNKDHCQYAGELPQEKTLQIISKAQGFGGSNLDYLLNTASHMSEEGINDSYIQSLADAARSFKA